MNINQNTFSLILRTLYGNLFYSISTYERLSVREAGGIDVNEACVAKERREKQKFLSLTFLNNVLSTGYARQPCQDMSCASKWEEYLLFIYNVHIKF